MNRFMRRMARFGRRGHDVPTDPAERETSQDVQSTRAKSSGHGKKTADKWNQ